MKNKDLKYHAKEIISGLIVRKRVFPIDKDEENMRHIVYKYLCHMSNLYDQKLDKAIRLLRELADIQNGAPLIRDADRWNEIMTEVYEFLNEHETI